MVLSSVLEPTR